MTKALIECELVECRVTPEKKVTNIGLLNAMGWNINNHGLQVELEAFKSNYILFQTKRVKAIYRHYNTVGTVKKVPVWIETLVVELKKWAEEGWMSSFVKMTPATASTATYVALISNKHYEENFIVSEDDESSSSSEEEDIVSKKGALIAK